MGLKGSERDWRALFLEMRADGISEENCYKLMKDFEEMELTPRKAVQTYRKALDTHIKDLAKEEKKAAVEAAIPRPDVFGRWS
ncbi:hypothetical protein hairong_101 [Pseudomonas phage hairong]|nr:hypothetical protein hairong_101 [Pseudomonas phage hairong]